MGNSQENGNCTGHPNANGNRADGAEENAHYESGDDEEKNLRRLINLSLQQRKIRNERNGMSTRPKRSLIPAHVPKTPEDMVGLPAGAGYSGNESALDTNKIALVFDLEAMFNLQSELSEAHPTDPLPEPPVRRIYGLPIPLSSGASIPKGSLTYNTTALEDHRPPTSSETPPDCVCREGRSDDPELVCSKCGGRFHLRCINTLTENHFPNGICPFCTSTLNYPFAQKCSGRGTSEYDAVVTLLDFMSTGRALGPLAPKELWSRFTRYCNGNKKAGGRWDDHIKRASSSDEVHRRGRRRNNVDPQDTFFVLLDKLNDIDSNVVQIYNTHNDDVENEYALPPPRCEILISGTGILNITNSVLSLGPWVVGSHGEFTCLFYRVALDTIEYSLNAAWHLAHENAPLNIKCEEDNVPHLSRGVLVYDSIYALGVSLPSRTCRYALLATQVIHAAVVYKMRGILDRDSFKEQLLSDKAALLQRTLSKLGSLSKRLLPLEKSKEEFSPSELRKQQYQLSIVLDTFATAVMGGDTDLGSDEVAEAVRDASTEDPGFAPLLQIMEALAGEDNSSLVNACTAMARLQINRCRLTEGNKWPLLLAASRRNSLSRVEELTLQRQCDQYGPRATDEALDFMHRNQWIRLRRQMKEAKMTNSDLITITVYDNMQQKFQGTSTRAIGKHELSQPGVAAFTFRGDANASLSSTLPTLAVKSDEGPVLNKVGQAAEPFLNPELFTLGARTDHNKNVTHHEELMRYFRSHVAIKLHIVLHYQKNKPHELHDWKCPSASSMTINFRKEAEELLGQKIGKTEVIPHESYAFDELTSSGTARTILAVVKTLELDVCSIMEERELNGKDGTTPIIAGDQATFEGIHSNITHLLRLIAAHIEKHGPDSPLESHPHLCHQIYMLLCHSSFTLWYGILHFQFAINDLRQKMFGSSINDPIRFYYSYFRHLRGDRHRVDDDDDWTEFFKLVTGGGWEAVISEFAIEQVDKIRRISSMPELVTSFLEHIECLVFGDDPASADGFLSGSDLFPPSSVDYPSATHASYLFLSFIYDSVHEAENTRSHHMAQTFHRVLHPLFLKYNKKNYGWLTPKIIAIMETVSPYAQSVLLCNTSFSTTGTPPCTGLDRACEALVKDLSSFPGDRAKTENQQKTLSRQKLAARTLQKWAREFFGADDRVPFARRLCTGRRASKTAISRRFFLDSGMVKRPVTARNKTNNSPLVPIANSRRFTIPFPYVEQQMRFICVAGQVLYCGTERNCALDINPSEGHLCTVCSSPVTPFQHPGESSAESIPGAYEDNDSEELCMGCKTSIVRNSQAAQCTHCQAALCTSCFSLNPGLARKPLEQLKALLKSINNGRLDYRYTKKAVIEGITEIRRLCQLRQFAEACPGLDLNASGTPLTAGAIVLRVGTVNLMRTSTTPQAQPCPIGDIIQGPLSKIVPGPESPDLSEESTFEVEVQKYAPGNLGMSLDDAVTRTSLSDDGSETNEIKVLDVDPSSEAMRLGIRPGDHIQTLNGAFLDPRALNAVLHSRPLWMVLRRPDPTAATASMPYVPPDTPSVVIIYYQPKHPGDPGERHSTAELIRSGSAAYLKKMHQATSLRLGTQLETALNVTFMHKDVDNAGYVKQTNTTPRVDTHAANRVRPIEPSQPETWAKTGLLLLLSFFRVNSKKNQRHSQAIKTYITTKFLPKERKIESYRQLVYPYIYRNRMKLRAYQDDIVRGTASVSDDTEQAVLSALANAKLEEATRFKQAFISSCEDAAWRQATPEAASIKWANFQAAMKSLEEAKDAQSAATKHLEEMQQRGAES